jgi:hypothetical protein
MTHDQPPAHQQPEHAVREHTHVFADESGFCGICGTHYRAYIAQLRRQLRAERKQDREAAASAHKQHRRDQAQIIGLQAELETLRDLVEELAQEIPDWDTCVDLHHRAVRVLGRLDADAEEE